jgi:hypothetical protein
MNFHVGQKVVCVNDKEGLQGWGWNVRPKKGSVYTVTAIGLTHSADPEQLPCILVAELERREDSPLWAHRFRPIRTTDISVFTAMLVPTPRIKERA